jgi:hypothetical protein
MNATVQAALSDTERLLVAETEPAQLAPLDEDAAVELHTRIRRARNKYVGQYRRAASARVAEKGGRGKARPENKRAAVRAEAFEIALSRVSRRLSVLASRSAAQLRLERLELARSAKKTRGLAAAGGASAARPTAAKITGELPDDRALRAPALQKRRATTRAVSARSQAKRDSR